MVCICITSYHIWYVFVSIVTIYGMYLPYVISLVYDSGDHFVEAAPSGRGENRYSIL